MARSGSNFRGPCPLDCKVYVGDLGTNGDRRELEDAFGRYGPLRNVWVARNPPGFAFVEFEDPRDAEDASRELDGRTLCGRRVRVEMSSGRSKPKRFGEGRRDDRDRRGGRDRDDRRGGRNGRDRDSRSRSRDRDHRRRSRSPRDAKRERSRSGSPRNDDSRRRGRAGSEEKNGVKSED
ncbi:serine/arginine-rich splicing factor 3-like [Paramacrobiotus metropolitanus]|uniref:serine/arginine-rich splicing factor 3-like n=1 Tax=Paramacrobiotus metropolitanus TaxID=2943436 RepID=UPI002445FB0B|nr:serine/arginine-rich splicing factor 3-like [Paramacrobiotus metropolitanus]XP_055331332.1 serine/arginine-rich splicing factor 3-like [Paramacrobiotus metropolitanus]XP_055331333.1 serine/arginine-rich splicing factor 3-like [Paramacrobiotus metropolitanus]